MTECSGNSCPLCPSVCECWNWHTNPSSKLRVREIRAQTFPRGWPAVAVVLLSLPSKSWSLRFLDVREANALVVCCAWGSKVTVIEVDGKALMLSGKLSLSRRAINGGTCGHPCVAWQIFTGPSRRRTSPKVSLNTSVTPGFMMFSRCLLLSNSHEANTGISVSHLELRLHFGKRRLRPDVQALAAAIHGLRVETIVATWQEVHARSPTLYQRPGGEQAVALARS